jgi:predicted exporter
MKVMNMKNQQRYSMKEKIMISLSFWPTLIIGTALGMTVCYLLILNIASFAQLIDIMIYSIIGLIIVGIVTRAISIYYWKKYNWHFTSDMK